MPLRMYDFLCTKCGEVSERLVAADEVIHSLCCGAMVERLMPAPKCNMGAAGAYGYYDRNLETYITSNRHRREVMREKGVCEKGSTPKPDGGAWV